MARFVLKYPIESDVIPEDHKFLYAATQGAQSMMWLEVDPESTFVPNPYKTFPTGFGEIPEGAQHQCTFINDWNKNVWHVYKVQP